MLSEQCSHSRFSLLAGLFLITTLICGCDSANPERPSGGAFDDSRLVTAIGALEDRVAELSDSIADLASRGSPNASGQPPVQSSSYDSARLIKAIEKLQQTLETEALRSPQNEIAGIGKVASAKQSESLEALLSLPKAEKKGMNFMWTGRELLRRYGPPDDVMASGVDINWIYRKQGKGMLFRIRDGFVIQSYEL